MILWMRSFVSGSGSKYLCVCFLVLYIEDRILLSAAQFCPIVGVGVPTEL